MYLYFFIPLPPVHLLSTGILIPCTSVLRGIYILGYSSIFLSNYHMAPVTTARRETPVILGNIVLQDLTRTPGLWVPQKKFVDVITNLVGNYPSFDNYFCPLIKSLGAWVIFVFCDSLTSLIYFLDKKNITSCTNYLDFFE